MERMTTSEIVKLELMRRNMTQLDLAEKLNVTSVTISNRLSTNAWKPMEIFYMKHKLGFNL